MMQALQGAARLSYVVAQLPGTVEREVTVFTRKDGLTKKIVKQPAGYMVYFPRGHVIRLKDKDALRHYGLDRPPIIINLEGLNDPRSPIGKMLMAQDEETRKGARLSLEKAVMQLATAKTGPVLMPEQVKDEE
jgi:hypothetical protein